MCSFFYATRIFHKWTYKLTYKGSTRHVLNEPVGLGLNIDRIACMDCLQGQTEEICLTLQTLHALRFQLKLSPIVV